MNLQQVKQDVDNKVFVTKETWLKVLEAALMMQTEVTDTVMHYQSESALAVVRKVDML